MRRSALVCFLLVASTTLAALATRPPWPVDETRYLGIAWDMWAGGDLLLPRLNGVLYSDKPPLLFWVMHAGWAAFGVNAWWPRLIGPICALLCLAVTARLARRLFPASPHASSTAAELAPLLLCGMLLFALWSTFLLFDVPLVLCALLALLGLLVARQDGGARGWLLFGAACGAGLLVKGPVIFVHVLPAAIAVRCWSRPSAQARNPSGGPSRGLSRGLSRGPGWAAGLSLGLLLALGIALIWVVPAARAGGPAFRDELLWGQAVSRLQHDRSVPHDQDWWFYALTLPGLMLPWTVWPRLWRAVAATRGERRAPAAADALPRPALPRPAVPGAALPRPALPGGDELRGEGGVDGLRFCLVWALPALFLLSGIGSKQEQYVLPLLPAFALLCAALLVRHAPAAGAPHRELLVPGLLVAACGLIIFAAARQLPPLDDPDLTGTSTLGGALLAAAGLGLALAVPRTLGHAVLLLSGACAAVVIAVHLAAPALPFVERDLRVAATRIAELQRQGRPLVFAGKYRGQYAFLGRLRAPLDDLPARELDPWLEAHGDGIVITHDLTPTGLPPTPGLRLLETHASGEHFWERGHVGGSLPRTPGPR
jgi:4-amino-4-deoxy-L-arabinose transferase-like glycosyltransferase